MSLNPQHNSDDNRLQALRELLDSGTLQLATRMLNALRPAEIAHLLESLPLTQRKVV